MSKKLKKVCTALNYVEHILILGCSITAAITKYKSITNKKKKKHDKIVLPTKSKLNTIEDLISKVLIYSLVSHHELVLTNMTKWKKK